MANLTSLSIYFTFTATKTNCMKKLFLIVALLLSISIIAQTEKYHRVKIDISEKGIMELSKAGIAVDHGEYKKGFSFTSDLSDDELKLVKKLGYTYKVEIEDVGYFYEHQNDNLKNYNPHNQVLSGGACSTCPQYQTPTNFNLGSMGGFFTYQEMLDNLDSMAAKFPNLISVRQQVGSTTTIEGNPLYYVKISDNPSAAETEPQVLYTSLHHAREAESLSQLIFYMWHLLENYNSDSEVQYLVNNLEMYFIPCLNPDGYMYNESTNPNGGGMWRKNRRNNGSGIFGVDLNRNYGDHWGYDDNGSSPDPNSDTYRGPSAFSEVETQLVRDFCNDHEFKLALNNHTYSNLLIYPYGYIASTLTPDSTIFSSFAKRMTKCSGFMYGTGDQTVGYLVNGDSDDWMYSEQTTKPMILSMTPEAGNSSDGFWPAINRIIPIAKITMDQNLSLARLATAYAETESIHDKFITSTNDYVKYNFKRLGLENGTFTVSVTPISTNIASVGSPKTYVNPAHLTSTLDSITITLNSGLTQGELVSYAIAVDNGSYAHYDTITRIYGQPIVAFFSDCNTSPAFTLGGWGVSSSQFVSATGSITDSPSGFYQNNANKSVTTLNNIDLTNALAATLSYYTKWDIEKGYDYVEILASTNGINYTQLCGKYTAEGSDNQNNGLPMYDGKQSEWVKENIDLVDYLGQNIKLRFKLVSDGFSTGDGFYFDDITVLKITNSVGVKEEINLNSVTNSFPNPCNDVINFAYSIPNQNEVFTITISDALGRIVAKQLLEKGSNTTSMNLSELTNGVYFYKISSPSFSTSSKPIVVMHE
jgi:carboxypeptidase T